MTGSATKKRPAKKAQKAAAKKAKPRRPKPADEVEEGVTCPTCGGRGSLPCPPGTQAVVAKAVARAAKRQGVAPKDCRHPPNARLGDTCMVCDTKVGR